MKANLLLVTLCVLNFQMQAQVAFTNSSWSGVGSGPTFLVSADVNGDSKVDLITANYGNAANNTLSVSTNNGNGGFVLASSPIVGNGPRMVTAADVNGDGKPDLIAANYGNLGDGNTLSVLTNNGSGGFVLASSPILSSGSSSVLALEVNGDGKPDLISVNKNNSLTVLTNKGNGVFLLCSNYTVGNFPVSVAAFTNVDGKVGLVTANYSANTLTVLTNTAGANFAIAFTLSVGALPVYVLAADVNGDGRVDFTCANSGDGTLSIWTNNGSGGFAPAGSPAVGNQPGMIAVADVSGDGKVDLISANYADSTLTVLTNNGNGGFGLAATLELTNHSETIVATDVNGDGKPDLISADSGNVLTVFLNTTPPKPPGATGTAIVSFGFVVGVTIDNGGFGYTNTPLVRLIGGGGSGAGAVAVVSNGVVVSITITTNGSGYTNAPLVVIEPPYIPNPVLNITPASFLNFSNVTVGGAYQLQKLISFYWTNLPVNFTSTASIYTQIVAGVVGSGTYRLTLTPVPTQAFATSTVSFGFVVHATVTSGGSGYVANPAVTIFGGGGTNATATSQISSGVVTNINITNLGSGYTNPPTVVIGQPPITALSPTVLPMMRLDFSNLAPYDNYQIQFRTNLNAAWGNVSGGLFSPTTVTYSQYLFITNGIEFFRVQFVP